MLQRNKSFNSYVTVMRDNQGARLTGAWTHTFPKHDRWLTPWKRFTTSFKVGSWRLAMYAIMYAILFIMHAHRQQKFLCLLHMTILSSDGHNAFQYSSSVFAWLNSASKLILGKKLSQNVVVVNTPSWDIFHPFLRPWMSSLWHCL